MKSASRTSQARCDLSRTAVAQHNIIDSAVAVNMYFGIAAMSMSWLHTYTEPFSATLIEAIINTVRFTVKKILQVHSTVHSMIRSVPSA